MGDGMQIFIFLGLVALAIPYFIGFFLLRRYVVRKNVELIHAAIPSKKRSSAILLFDGLCLMNSLLIGYFGFIVAALFYAEGSFSHAFHTAFFVNDSPISMLYWIFIPLSAIIAIQIILWFRLSRNSPRLKTKVMVFLYECAWVLIIPAFIILMMTVVMAVLFIILVIGAILGLTSGRLGINEKGELCRVI